MNELKLKLNQKGGSKMDYFNPVCLICRKETKDWAVYDTEDHVGVCMDCLPILTRISMIILKFGSRINEIKPKEA